MTSGMLRIRRRHGALSGTLLLLLGAWGGIIAFVGPYFHYSYTPAVAWTYNTDRLWLEILPGAATFLGGLLLVVTSRRILAMFGALLAAVSGAWFALGTVLSPVWKGSLAGGTPTGTTTTMRVLEQIGFFTGLGVVIVFLAAVALGRLTLAPQPAEPVSDEPETEPAADATEEITTSV